MKKESKRHILSTVAVILAAVAAVTVLFVLHHKQQQEKARQPEESISQAEDNTIEWNGKRYTYNNNLINILFLGIYEDEATTYKVVYKSSKIARIKSALYFYRQRSGSITQLEKSIKEINEQYIALKEKYDFFRMKNEVKIAKFAETKLAIYMISVYKIRKELTGEYKDWRKKIKKIFNDIYYESSIPLKYKIYLLVFIIFPNLCKKE